MKKIKIIFRNKTSTLPEIPSKSNLINAIYYDTDWWNKKWALEWWNKSGHFNEDLYRNILLAKLDSINALQSTNK
jgi:hypothetical protein